MPSGPTPGQEVPKPSVNGGQDASPPNPPCGQQEQMQAESSCLRAHSQRGWWATCPPSEPPKTHRWIQAKRGQCDPPPPPGRRYPGRLSALSPTVLRCTLRSGTPASSLRKSDTLDSWHLLAEVSQGGKHHWRRLLRVPQTARRSNRQSYRRSNCQSYRKSTLNMHWKDWCWSSSILATWRKEPVHWKRPWCWERLRAGGEGDGRGWDGWMASPTRWTWVWAQCRRQWRTGKPGMLQSMGWQRAGHDLVNQQQKSVGLGLSNPKPDFSSLLSLKEGRGRF